MAAHRTGRHRLAALYAHVQRLLKNSEANVLALFAIAAVPLLGCVGLGLDAAQWVLWKRQLHTAADAGALAGALARSENQDIDAAVRRSLALNDLRNFTITAIENAPTEGLNTGNVEAVRVVLDTQEALPFSGLFLSRPPVLRASAVAVAENAPPNCVIGLDTSSTAVSLTGSSTIDMNCGIISNSNLDATSSDSINAAALSAVGMVVDGAAVTSSTRIRENVSPVADPFAYLPVPNANGNCSPNTHEKFNRDATISPGCYLGIDVTGGTLTMSPGIYTIGEKDIKVAGGAGLVGDGVTIIFTSTGRSFNDNKIGTLNVSGNSKIRLTATTSGTYAGVLMYQDPRTPSSSVRRVKVTGNSDSKFQGAIYAPSIEVAFTGSSFMQTSCMQIVAKFVTFTGNTAVSNSCPVGSGASSFGGSSSLRLVE